MTITTKYQVRDANGTVSTQNSLRDAVLTAAGEDGFGAVFQRDESGAMRLYSSSKHIGNNTYFPQSNEAFTAESMLADDDLAEVAVAEDMLKRGVLHSKHRLEIAILTFEDNLLTEVDGRLVAELAEEWDATVTDVRAIYK